MPISLAFLHQYLLIINLSLINPLNLIPLLFFSSFTTLVSVTIILLLPLPFLHIHNLNLDETRDEDEAHNPNDGGAD
ncbi:hypothetical protein CF336_g8502, partial [Tilletia laevis]